jgi:hypothetical protein
MNIDCDLTDDEKRRVVRYLRQNAEWSKSTLKNLGITRHVAELRKKIRCEIAALEFVASWIENLIPRESIMSATETIEPLAASGDVAGQTQANDIAATNFQSKFSANYGSGGFDWQSILAAILSMLGGCAIPLTPANLKTQISRPLVQARLLVKLWTMGVPASVRSRAVAAIVKTLHDGSDAEITSWVAAAQEGE